MDRLAGLLATVEQCRSQTTDSRRRANLDWLAANLEFTLLLDEVGRRIEPAYSLKNRWLTGHVATDKWNAEKQAALTELKAAPIAELIKTYARRVRSRGEQGVLSALNQKLWLQYKELGEFLRDR